MLHYTIEQVPKATPKEPNKPIVLKNTPAKKKSVKKAVTKKGE